MVATSITYLWVSLRIFISHLNTWSRRAPFIRLIIGDGRIRHDLDKWDASSCISDWKFLPDHWIEVCSHGIAKIEDPSALARRPIQRRTLHPSRDLTTVPLGDTAQVSASCMMNGIGDDNQAGNEHDVIQAFCPISLAATLKEAGAVSFGRRGWSLSSSREQASR